MYKRQDLILRLYESKKAAVTSKVNCSLGMEEAYLCDMLENVQEAVEVNGDSAELTFGAFEIKTLRVKVRK